MTSKNPYRVCFIILAMALLMYGCEKETAPMEPEPETTTPSINSFHLTKLDPPVILGITDSLNQKEQSSYEWSVDLDNDSELDFQIRLRTERKYCYTKNDTMPLQEIRISSLTTGSFFWFTTDGSGTIGIEPGDSVGTFLLNKNDFRWYSTNGWGKIYLNSPCYREFNFLQPDTFHIPLKMEKPHGHFYGFISLRTEILNPSRNKYPQVHIHQYAIDTTSLKTVIIQDI